MSILHRCTQIRAHVSMGMNTTTFWELESENTITCILIVCKYILQKCLKLCPKMQMFKHQYRVQEALVFLKIFIF